MGRGLGVDKPCVKCGREVPHAYKSPIPGFCGRCTDEVLRTLQASQSAPDKRSARLAALAGGGAGKGALIGALVMLLLLLAVAVFANGPFTAMVDGIRSAIEDVPIDAWRREFEVNLFSCTRLIQKVLPGMRAAGSGTIVNISSVAGRIAPPFSGAYAATKFALEAMSDALRVEVAAFGVRVILVEPGPVATNFAAYAKARSTAILESDDTQYSAGYKGFLGQVDALHRDAWTARAVADMTMAAIRSSRPPMRVACYGWTLRAGLFLRAVAPGLLDRVMARRTRA